MGGTPDIPPPPPPPAPPPVPTMDKARERTLAQDIMAGRRGRAANILTSATGALAPSSDSKTQLGK